MVDPAVRRVRREKACRMWYVRHRICACDGCGGHLEPVVNRWLGDVLECVSCRCLWRIEGPHRLHRHLGRRAQWYPSSGLGVCSAANRWLAEWTAEVEREAARRHRDRAAD